MNDRAAPGALTTAVYAVVLFGLALASRVALIDLPPVYDELYQMLPAKSWIERGDFAVLDGFYERSSLFTRIIALSFQAMGEMSVEAARLLPSVVPGALLVAVVFAWTRLVFGALAGWIVAIFVLLWPNGIEVSQFARFYALQGLFFFLGAIAIYHLFDEGRSLAGRIALGLAAAVAMLFATALQIVTLIGLMGVAIWFLAFPYLPLLRAHIWVRVASAIGAVAVIGVLASGVFTDDLVWLWTTYRWEPWPPANDVFFYHREFRDAYPTFWPLLPLLAVVAVATKPRPAFLCVAIFGVSIVMQSFGGLKGLRYLYQAMPFFFIVCAVGTAAAAERIFAYAAERAEDALGSLLSWRSRGVRAAGVAVAAICALFLVMANAAFERALQLMRGVPADTLVSKARVDWRAAGDLADPWIDQGAIIVVSGEILAVEWLGDFDVGYNKPRFSELLYTVGPDAAPFTKDARTGRPLIGEIEDFRRLMICEPVGLYLAGEIVLRREQAVDVLYAAQAVGATIDISSKDGVAAIGWRRDGPRDEADCAAITPPPEDRAATRIRSGERPPVLVSGLGRD